MSTLKSDHVVAERSRLKQRIGQTAEAIYRALTRMTADNCGLETTFKVIQKYITRRVQSELKRARRGPRPR
jgi:hypothetical protein